MAFFQKDIFLKVFPSKTCIKYSLCVKYYHRNKRGNEIIKEYCHYKNYTYWLYPLFFLGTQIDGISQAPTQLSTVMWLSFGKYNVGSVM